MSAGPAHSKTLGSSGASNGLGLGANSGAGLTAQWSDLPQKRLSSEDVLPATASAIFDVGLNRNGLEDISTKAAGRGSYVADFGILDIPKIGEIQARAGLHYGRLHKRGALVLGVRKELRSMSELGYELSLGAQSVGDDKRLDFLGDLRILKFFKSAVAFYRFLWALGGPYGDNPGPSWNEMGSALGVSQQNLPPGGLGELTVGWRAGLLEGCYEGVPHPGVASAEHTAARKESRAERRRKGKNPTETLLDSTPYVAYGVQFPAWPCFGGTQQARTQVATAVLPQHDAFEHSLRLDVAGREGTPHEGRGQATVLATVEQSMSQPSQARLRVGVSMSSK